MSNDIWTYNLDTLYKQYRIYKCLESDKIYDEREKINK